MQTRAAGRVQAADVGVSDTTVQRIWQTHGLKPHRVKGFKAA
jgi:hypothetical protein